MELSVSRAARVLSLALPLLALSCDEGDHRLPRETRAYRSTPCWFVAPKDVRVVCGNVTLPENPGDAENTAEVTIAVARFLTPASRPLPDPLVFLTGGPGQDAATIAAQVYEELHVAAGDRDIVAIDQRGTGKSTPSLACGELSVPRFEGDPIGAFEACRNRITAGGHDVGAFRTSLNAGDIEAARIAMGYPAWNLLGFSYGTRLALTVARDHPEGVRSMVLSSVVPLEADILRDTPASAQRSFERVFATCAADAACDANHPELEARFRDAVADLDAMPQSGTSGARSYTFSGSDVVDVLFQLLYDSTSIPYAPQLMEAAIAGDLDPFADIAVQLDRSFSNFSYGMHLSVQCADELPFSALGTPDPAVDPFYGAVFQSSYVSQCAAWKVPASPPIENVPVTSGVPTLAIAGGFDPITPPSYAEQVVASLAQATLVEFPNGGHSIGLSDACSGGLIASFLETQSVDSAAAACATSTFPLAYRSHRSRFHEGPLDDDAIARIVEALRRPRL